MEELDEYNVICSECERIKKRWGGYTILEEGLGWKIKILEVLPGKELSVQKHMHRCEHWTVLSGAGVIIKGNEEEIMYANQYIYIPPNVIHTIKNKGIIPLKIAEIQFGEYLGEDDIERVGCKEVVLTENE